MFLTVFSVSENPNMNAVRDCTHISRIVSKEQCRNAQFSFVSLQVSTGIPHKERGARESLHHEMGPRRETWMWRGAAIQTSFCSQPLPPGAELHLPHGVSFSHYHKDTSGRSAKSGSFILDGHILKPESFLSRGGRMGISSSLSSPLPVSSHSHLNALFSWCLN